jgi:2-hydroxy-3-keto-5-methylthiopentenyl-1-phosphate phosphatase
MSNMSESTLTLEQMKDLISFCRANNVNYVEYVGFKVQLIPDSQEIKQPTTEELLYGNFQSWSGTPGDSRKV